jgi:alpha-galactosidase
MATLDKMVPMINRRGFLGQAGAAISGTALAQGPAARAGFVDVLRPPDHITLQSAAGRTRLQDEKGVEVSVEPVREGNAVRLPIYVTAPATPLERICLRWQGAVADKWRLLGDAWERSYGDLEWRGSVPNRVMPWYFLAHDGRRTHGLGVQTGCASFCFWQTDPQGISLWLDVRNGGAAVELGERRLHAATVVAAAGESPYPTVRELCRRMCARPRLPERPVYGGNNWYYTYGDNFTAPDIVRDSELLAELAGSERNRPFMVIDMGWSPAAEGAGPIAKGNMGFPDMPGLAEQMKGRGVRPGIWVRPLLTVEKIPESWRLPANGLSGPLKPPFAVIDPSVPEALAQVSAAVRGVHEWGYELIKHDFTTYDLFGRWGFQMDAQLTNRGWHFADRSRTNAEIIAGLYRALREAAGSSLLLGCNTVGHLGAGEFELQRIGDDTSGREWERTRKMGVNTLAFRLPQHDTFFAADADCVPVTAQIPWEYTRQWLDLVARSGTPLFVSADPKVVGAEQKAALKAAFAVAARKQTEAESVGWLDSTAPEKWRLGGQPAEYRWYGEEGASPFAK